MTAAARAEPDPLDGWRRWRAAHLPAQAANTSSPANPAAALVASVASDAVALATPPNPRKSAPVASVASVASAECEGGGKSADAAALALAIGAADLWLTKRAVELARLAEGGEVRPCPTGGLDLVGPDGRAGWFSAGLLAELCAARLLHPAALAALRGGGPG